MSHLVVKMVFPGKDGKKIPIELPVSSIRKVVSDLLRVAAAIPQKPALVADIQNDPNPIQITAFAISPVEGSHDQARLSIGVGPADLQLSISLSDLFQAFRALETQSEPDPTSSRRPH
jgi:hypothetical protein